ncbi:Dabb family protein [Streptomyces bacillaris]|uniref:Dabb family protein n=1 Tax=Streptomyces bacillaris TaxID=68179 RepID=UPI0036D7BDAB
MGINSLPVNEFDIVLVSDFEDEAALQRYIVNPEHEKVASYIRSVVSGRASVDAEY